VPVVKAAAPPLMRVPAASPRRDPAGADVRVARGEALPPAWLPRPVCSGRPQLL